MMGMIRNRPSESVGWMVPGPDRAASNFCKGPITRRGGRGDTLPLVSPSRIIVGPSVMSGLTALMVLITVPDSIGLANLS